MSTVLYREKQPFHLGWGRLTLAMPVVGLVVITLRQMVWHHPWGNPPVSDSGLILLTCLILLVYLRLITVRLITELRPGRLSVKMKGFWRRAEVPLENVRRAVPVEYHPLADFGGYGFRSGHRGYAYTASGNRAVQLELRDGKNILVGSQHPEELARRIAEARHPG